MIPYHRVYTTGREIEYINDSINHGHISGDGYYTKLVESFISNKFNISKVYMTTSATHALELAMLLIDLKPGDEVIMPSFTFSSTANSVLLRGATPVFAEIDPDTLNITPDSIDECITNRTKAIIPVHYAGVCCEMDRIMELAEAKGLFAIEDAAQAVNSRYKEKYSGSMGHMGCYSFHGTKNYTCGEGGALLLNSNAAQLLERADCIRQKGTDRSKFLRREVSSYSWVDIGSSYSPSDILMAMLYAQFEQIEEITMLREKIHVYYSDLLKKYDQKQLIRVMNIPPACDSNYHIFYLQFREENIRKQVMTRLNEKGVNAVTHFVPLHSSAMGQKLGYHPGDLEITENTSRCILRLPIYAGMTEDDMIYVGDTLKHILEEL